ncbi:MAG: HAD family hydrolase, partial [Cyanobacteria bacterium P01_H01_bin.58]
MATLTCQGKRFEHIAAVLFDKDGTLADSHGFLHKLAIARSQYLEQHVPGTGSSLMAAFGCDTTTCNTSGLMAVGTRYENEIAAATYVAAQSKAWGEALVIAQQAFIAADQQFRRKAIATPPYADIVPMLEQLARHGVRLAVLSGDTTPNVQDFVDCYDLTHLVSWCAGSEKMPRKPDPQMLWQACQQLQVLPEHSLVIGDSILDRQLAHQGQAQAFISVTWGGSAAIDGADAIAQCPKD